MRYLIFQVAEGGTITQAGAQIADHVPAALAAFYARRGIEAPETQRRYFARREGSMEAQNWVRQAAAARGPRNTRPRYTVTLSGPEKRALEQAARVCAETTDRADLAVYALRAVDKLQGATPA